MGDDNDAMSPLNRNCVPISSVNILLNGSNYSFIFLSSVTPDSLYEMFHVKHFTLEVLPIYSFEFVSPGSATTHG